MSPPHDSLVAIVTVMGIALVFVESSGSGDIDLVNCTESECGGTEIVCGAASSCLIMCGGPSSCSSVSISVETDSSLHLDCSDEGCSSISIVGSSNSRSAVSCLGHRSCSNLRYYGLTNSSVTMLCSGESACAEAEVVGGSNGSIDIQCDGRFDCDHIVVDGKDAALLAVHNCSAYEVEVHRYALSLFDCLILLQFEFPPFCGQSCWSMTIWCPEHSVNGEKRCILEGDGNGWDYDGWGPMTLYAVNSWQDLEFRTAETSVFYQV